jgi:glycosyltransferase involved in cell wall biosynthesis
MDGRAASHTITDKIPHILAKQVTPIVLSAVTGQRDSVVEHHQLLPVSPAGLRFDLRFILRRHISSKPGYKLAVGLMTLLILPFYVLEKLFVRLEPQWSWFVTAYFAGARIIRQRKPEVIYSTGGANSAHLAGYLLAKRFSLPWVAEIHDPMIYENWERRRMAYRFAARLEGKICERADVAIWFVDTALDRARKRHPVLGNRGKVMIPGADQPAFGKIPYRRGAELVIGHFGSLSLTRNLATFMGGLAMLLQKRPGLRRILRLEIYGSGLDSVSARAVDSFAFPEVVRKLGRLERDPVSGDSGRDRVLKRMQTVDALLMLHGTGDFCEEYIPSKLYEYLWTQRPIIGLTWRNAHLDRILKEGGHWAVRADDVPCISATLEHLEARWERDELRDSGQGSPYTVTAAVDQLCGWVDEAVKRRAAQNEH